MTFEDDEIDYPEHKDKSRIASLTFSYQQRMYERPRLIWDLMLGAPNDFD
jgi:hypothetical protein